MRLGSIALLLLLSMLVLACCPSVRAESPLPAPSTPASDRLGVNIHFTDPRPGETKMLADAGFKWVRMDFSWGATERQKGTYDFSAYDRLLASLDPHHIRALLILDYANPHYDNNVSPHTDEGRAAFARWAGAAVVHFKNRGVVWEMYNEPNGSFWSPKRNVDQYIKLALAVGKAIRQADPDAIYIGPASSTMDFKYLEACFKAGCLKYWSAVSVHPYRQNGPETVVPDYQHLRDLIKQYAPAGKSIPIISGEWGYSSAWKHFDPEKQGKLLPRELLVNLASGVPISIWYDWHDDGTNAHDPEHHFGIVFNAYRAGRDPVYDPKPAYLAMKTLSTSLGDCAFSRRLDLPNKDDWALLFTGPHGLRAAIWTTGKNHDANIPLPPGKYHVVNYTGKSMPDVESRTDGLSISLTDAPMYLSPIDLHR